MLPEVPSIAAENAFVVRFENLPRAATLLAGGKGASLSRMVHARLPVPPGFVVSSAAFQSFLETTRVGDTIVKLTNGLDVHDDSALESAANTIRERIAAESLPEQIRQAIAAAYEETGSDTLVAVRSSAVGEDGEAASFAGQQETFLNVRGLDAVARHLKECWASFFSSRAMFYRAQKGALTDCRMAVVVQEMVQPDKSGVMFTVDPVQKQREHMVIEAIYGLGEAIVSGLLTPDHYVIDRNTGAIVREFVSIQPMALMFDSNAGRTVEVELPEDKGRQRVLSERELNQLREMGLRLESLFGSPQDVEWGIRGGELLLLQSRPITTL